MLRRFIKYYKPYKGMFFLDMLASFLIALIGLLYPIITNNVVKTYVPENNTKMIIVLGIFLLICYIIRMFLKFFVQYYGHMIGTHMQADMRKEMFIKLQRLPFSYFDEHETGKIMSRMTNDLQQVSELAHHGPENFFICGITMILSFVYLLTIDYRFALWILAAVPFLFFVSLFFRKRLNRANMENRKSLANINARLESSITGIRVTKAFTNDEKELEKFEESNLDFVKSKGKMYKAMGQFGSSTSFITDLFNFIIIVAGGLIVAPSKDTASYVTFVVSVSMFITPLTTLINFVEQFEEGVTGFQRFVEIIDEKEEETDKDAKNVGKLEGKITFDHVTFNYDTKQTEDNVLDDISFEIDKGKTIALVGASGGGKTTICHLIPNFYHPSKGHVYIDDIDVNKMTFQSLRKNIGLVQQDVFLFNGTIKDNIRYGNYDASDEDIIKASKMANIHDYITSLEKGYDTIVGERGVKLSGGQKQRISIARVFLKNPSILILDEATSALDNVTESLIQKSLNDLAKGRTTLIVAHRLSTIKNSDLIYVIEKGKIIEKGNHEELLSRNGEYAYLYKGIEQNQTFDQQ